MQHCIDMAEQLGFRILQFNAVVRSNRAALALYRKLGFVQLGIIPGGFRLNDGSYEDIIPHYYLLGEEELWNHGENGQEPGSETGKTGNGC